MYEYDEGASQRIQRQTSRTPIENLSYQQKLAQAGVGGYPGVCYNKKGGKREEGHYEAQGGKGYKWKMLHTRDLLHRGDMKSFARRRMKTYDV